ncbi:MAG: ankyrin repeat domain-containing protein [Verrucomicrobiae bacterium]|nr:ankyrin repeat domain-containing protein [Verrucomicrobiae bacterium]
MNSDWLKAFPVRMAGLALLLVGISACSDPEKTASQLLEEKQYSMDVNGLLLAAEAGDLDAIKLFREAGQDVNAADEAGDTALMRAAAGGRIGLAEVLLDAGGDPRAKNSKGRTPLMFAAEKGRAEVVKTLLSRGADVAAADSEGWTALRLAAYQGQADVVELLAGRVDQSALDQALLVACFKGDAEVIDHLVKQGAYVNTRSPENLTPLMIAAQEGHAEAVKLLIRHQANPYALDNEEHTAANLAEASGHLDLRDLLLDPEAVMAVADSAWEEPGAEPLLDPLAAEDAITRTLGALAEPVGEGSAKRDLVTNDDGPGKPVGVGLTPRSSDDVPVPGTLVPSTPTKSHPVISTGEVHRPIASIAGQTLPADSAEAGRTVVSALRMENYREMPLPVMLKAVEPDKGVAQVRVLSSRDNQPVEVKEGEMIPGTVFKVASMDSQFISSKMGKGKLVDVSRLMLEDTRDGARHLLVKDVPGRATDTYATLTLPGSPFEYVVKNGDVFRALSKEGKEEDYEVLDVRPTQVVIRNVASDEVVTVNRGGLAMR